MDLSLDDLVCLSLLEQATSSDETPGDESDPLVARSPTGIATALGIDPDDVRARLDVFDTATTLVARGDLTDAVRTTDDGTERYVYELTDAGRERAVELRRRVVEDTECEPAANGDAVATRPLTAVLDTDPGAARSGLSSSPDVSESSRFTGHLFVGRADELEELTEVIERIESRGGQTLFVTGEAGVGKSALVERFLSHAHESGIVVGRAACQRGSEEPYGPLRRAIGSAFDWSVLEPLAATDRPGMGDGAILSARRSALLGDVSTAVCDRSTTQPTVLFVDDLQWADASTLALFERLADECAAWVYPLLLVGAYRPGSCTDDDRLTAMRRRLSASTRVSELPVQPFDRETTGGFVRYLVGEVDVPDGFVDRVHESTGGTPLVVEEAVTGLLAADELDPERGRYPRTVDVDGGAEWAIEHRVHSLDETGREIMETASVVGRRVDYDVLQSAVSLPESTLRDYVTLLVDDRLLNWTGEPGADAVQFASGLVRETILADLDEDRRQRLHERAVAGLIEAGAPPSTIAEQCEAAGQLAAAIDHYERAAERARATYAGAAAIESYERALDLAERLDVTDRATSLRLELGRTRFVRGEPERAATLFETACEDAIDDELACRACHRLAEIRIKGGTVAAGLDVAEAGLERASEAVSAADRCRLHRVRGWGLLQLGELDGARDAFERQLAVANAADEPLLRALSNHDLGSLDGKTGAFERAEERLTSAVSAFDRLDEANYCSKSLTNLSLVYRQSGDLQAAIEANERALSLQRKHGFQETLPDSRLNQALLYRASGNLSRAVEEYEAAVEVAGEIGREERAGKARINLAQVHARRGRLDLAEVRCREAIATFEEFDGTDGLTLAYATRSRIHDLAGAFDRAREDADASLALARELGNDDRIAEARNALGRVHRTAGDPETACTHLEAASELAAAGANDVDGTRYRLELVAGLLDAGRSEAAHDVATTALAAAANTDERLLEARARSRYGACCVELGDHDRAETELGTALEIQRTCGATADRCASLLALCDLDLARSRFDAAQDRLDVVTALIAEYGLERFSERVAQLRDRLERG